MVVQKPSSVLLLLRAAVGYSHIVASLSSKPSAECTQALMSMMVVVVVVVVTWQVLEIRGGSVLFEAGATGGLFVGVVFIDDPDVMEVSR